MTVPIGIDIGPLSLRGHHTVLPQSLDIIGADGCEQKIHDFFLYLGFTYYAFKIRTYLKRAASVLIPGSTSQWTTSPFMGDVCFFSYDSKLV
jgi:hypothetical protein